MMRRLLLVLVSVLFSSSLFAQRGRAIVSPAQQQPGFPLSGVSDPQRASFLAGQSQFNVRESIETGLGPVFNRRACVSCHGVPAAGGGDLLQRVTRIGTITAGKFDELTRFGGSVLQDNAIIIPGSTHPFQTEAMPRQATIVVHRRSPPLFGLGLVDATPDATFFDLAQQQALRHDGTAGRPNIVDNLVTGTKSVGKFGWKAQIATLFEFAGDALITELGITNPLFPNENCPSGNCAELEFNPAPGLNDGGDRLRILADYLMFLAPTPPVRASADAQAGEVTFNRIGCDACHVATLQTGPNVSVALDRITYHPYSDFLLHDMGPLGDGIEQGTAKGSEIRTAPLWGLRFIGTLLHDGQTPSVEEAIKRHNGQARAARDRFVKLSQTDREKLLAFLQTL